MQSGDVGTAYINNPNRARYQDRAYNPIARGARVLLYARVNAGKAEPRGSSRREGGKTWIFGKFFRGGGPKK